ncbi:hypothetical protein I6N90_15180 [Paenibacillus sp. GSMTC-2017]|uniref:hypothetical protein n=1 Tax=Paenibacillus sp. GSMTC-2017 TaxID=2794350 RepID=UPI0018D6EC24|nr:hypothetical protein [Paenibacillus sp. GSMTC-2017]MBH5319149.1 hypothetical protein [Paenibacillus sp. GSMTC-2017]
MKAHKFFNIMMAVFFCLAISIPLIAVNKTPGKVSTSENRVLAQFPSFNNEQGGLNTHFIKEFETWFNDNLGLREKFVKTNTMMQYKLFGELTKQDTMVGKEGWLYYVTPEIIKDYQHLNLPTDEQLEQWGKSINQIDDYLKSKDIPFITMLNLDKKTIYPEYYPDTILKVGNVSRTDLLEEYFTNKTDLDFFTPKNALLEEKNRTTIYSPNFDNGHWNSYGAFIGYTELMKKVSSYYPDIKVLTWADINTNAYDRTTNIYDAVTFSEKDISLSLKNKSTATQVFGVLDKLNLSTSLMSASYQNEDKSLPKVLVLGDSYLYGFVTPYLAESFSEMNFIYTDNIDRIKMLVEYLDPDMVIYENVERSFDKTMSILSTSTEFSTFKDYIELPISQNATTMWIDFLNGAYVEQQDNINVDKSTNVTSISGWAMDAQAQDVASNIFLKVGDKYYSGSYGIARNSVSEHFNNPKLLNSGFAFSVPSSELIEAGKFSFVIISKDEKYQYHSSEYKVIVK